MNRLFLPSKLLTSCDSFLWMTSGLIKAKYLYKLFCSNFVEVNVEWYVFVGSCDILNDNTEWTCKKGLVSVNSWMIDIKS